MDKENVKSAEGKCPFGYDSSTFKISPLSCVICKCLLYNTCRCVPCQHIYCRICISKYNDCIICGAAIESLKDDEEIQQVVDKFISGHLRNKPSSVKDQLKDLKSTVAQKLLEEGMDSYRSSIPKQGGAFLLEQAMRALRAGNIDSAKSRLILCANDLKMGNENPISVSESSVCQLGAVLGLLGDCCRMQGNNDEAIGYFEQSVSQLSSLNSFNPEIVHALSVSLNKIGDLQYHGGNLQAARSFYLRGLHCREAAIDGKELSSVHPSQVLDIAVSLAKVADVDRAVGDSDSAAAGFQRAAHVADQAVVQEDGELASRKSSTLGFILSQLGEKK